MKMSIDQSSKINLFKDFLKWGIQTWVSERMCLMIESQIKVCKRNTCMCRKKNSTVGRGEIKRNLASQFLLLNHNIWRAPQSVLMTKNDLFDEFLCCKVFYSREKNFITVLLIWMKYDIDSGDFSFWN
jgi:hypothetical protein